MELAPAHKRPGNRGGLETYTGTRTGDLYARPYGPSLAPTAASFALRLGPRSTRSAITGLSQDSAAEVGHREYIPTLPEYARFELKLSN
jgi:hypothetical protein